VDDFATSRPIVSNYRLAYLITICEIK